MSRLRQLRVHHSPFGWDPLDDPLNHDWDAVVRRDRPMSANAESDDVALLRRLHALDATTLPIPRLLWRIRATAQGRCIPRRARFRSGSPGHGSREFGTPLPPRIHQDPPPRRHRMIFMPAAMAVLVLVLITSLGVRYFAVPRSPERPAIPAATIVEPTMETLVQLDFTPALFGTPAASTWTHMYFNLIQIDPGTSFTTDTDWYTSIDGPLLIQVLSGELTIHPTGPALFSADVQQDQAPEEISPGQSVSLGPDSAIVYSAVDPATGSNSGSEPVMALQVSIGQLTFSGPGTEAAPNRYQGSGQPEGLGNGCSSIRGRFYFDSAAAIGAPGFVRVRSRPGVDVFLCVRSIAHGWYADSTGGARWTRPKCRLRLALRVDPTHVPGPWAAYDHQSW